MLLCLMRLTHHRTRISYSRYVVFAAYNASVGSKLPVHLLNILTKLLKRPVCQLDILIILAGHPRRMLLCRLRLITGVTRPLIHSRMNDSSELRILFLLLIQEFLNPAHRILYGHRWHISLIHCDLTIVRHTGILLSRCYHHISDDHGRLTHLMYERFTAKVMHDRIHYRERFLNSIYALLRSGRVRHLTVHLYDKLDLASLSDGKIAV